MALTISPAVCRARSERVAARGMLAAGVLGGSFLVYGLLRGVLHNELGIRGISLPAVIIAVGLWGAIRDVGIRIPVPYLNLQVPEWFRSLFRLPLTSLFFGFLLGLGFVTKFTYGAHLTLMLTLALLAPPKTAALALAAYAFARTLNTLVGSRAPTAGALAQELQRLRNHQWMLRPASILLSAALISCSVMLRTH